MSKLIQETLEKIQTEKIEPKPRWHFLLKNYILWGFGVISILIGSTSFSVIMFLASDHDWDAYHLARGGFWGIILPALPYFWFFILVIFAGVAFYNFRQTKNNYRYKAYVIFLFSFIISIFLGSLLFIGGFGRIIDQTFSKRMPVYNCMVKHRVDVWQSVERGLLAGQIIKIKSNQYNFDIRDLKEKEWKISAEGAQLRGPVIIKVGERIKMIGEIVDLEKRIFKAVEVRPWKGVGRRMIFFEIK